MTAREELILLKKQLNISTDEELAEILNTGKGNINSWVARNKIPDKWRLIINHSIMEKKEGSITPSLPLENPVQLDRILGGISKSEGIELRYYPDVNASAGYGTQNDVLEHETITISRFFLQSLRVVNLNRLDIIRIYGDSMEPDFSNGEYVVVERVDTIDDVKTGNTVIANIDGDTYIKKLEKIPFEKTIVLHSTNNGYDPIKITSGHMDEVNIVGIVRGVIGLR